MFIYKDFQTVSYLPEIAGLTIPVDKPGAKYMYTVNAREPMYYPQDIAMAAKIFTVAEEDWTATVTRVPVSTAMREFLVMKLRAFCSLSPAAHWMPSLVRSMPNSRRPRVEVVRRRGRRPWR